MWMIRLFAACLLSTQLSFAGDREFKEIVRSISQEFHSRPIRIPLFGIVNTFLFATRPEGTKHMDIAVFENLAARDSAGRSFDEIVRKATAGRWSPFVRVISQRDGEQTFIYMRAEGRDCRLLLTSIEATEATVIQLKLNPDAVQRWLKEPGRSARSHGRDDRSREPIDGSAAEPR